MTKTEIDEGGIFRMKFFSLYIELLITLLAIFIGKYCKLFI